MSDSTIVGHLGGDRFAVEIRGHTITASHPGTRLNLSPTSS
jgi:hypothetical protein